MYCWMEEITDDKECNKDVMRVYIFFLICYNFSIVFMLFAE